MNENPALDFISRHADATAILGGIAPEPDKKNVTLFLRRVAEALMRHPEQQEWLESMNTPQQQIERAEKFIKHLSSAIKALQAMDDGTDSVIHQHFSIDQGVSLPVTKIGGHCVETNLQALIQATRAHKTHDIEYSSKLNPKKRRHMPLLFHVGQAWKECFWNDENQSPPINANENSVFSVFTDFLIRDVVGDRHHRNESLIRIAKKEGLLP